MCNSSERKPGVCDVLPEAIERKPGVCDVLLLRDNHVQQQ